MRSSINASPFTTMAHRLLACVESEAMNQDRRFFLQDASILHCTDRRVTPTERLRSNLNIQLISHVCW